MSQRLRLNVDAVDDEIRDRGVGARIEIQRDTTEAFAAPTSLGPVTLVAGQTQYEFFDATGSTTNWYRFRLTTSSGTVPSDWSAAFRGGADEAYATLDSLKEVIRPPDSSRDNYLSDLLVDASAYLTTACERDFFRHPAVSGEETRIFDGSGTSKLRVDAGIVSLSLVELAPGTGSAYVALAANDWVYWPSDKADDFSYEAVMLSDVGAYTVWSSGYATVRLTGVFGWQTIPGLIRRATLDLAREWYRQGPGGGGPVGVNQFGTPIFGGQEPKTVRDAVARYNARHAVH